MKTLRYFLLLMTALCACKSRVQEAAASTCFEAAREMLDLCTINSSEPCPTVFGEAFDRCVAERKAGQPVCYQVHLGWRCVLPSMETFIKATERLNAEVKP
jgi:hypothetical protein